MISDPGRTTLISSVGWVDRDALWRSDVRAARAERLPLQSGARWVTLHSSGSARFSIGHRFDGARFEVTVHSFSDPTRVLARAAVKENENEFVGDASAWGGVPLLYVEHLTFAPWNDFGLIKVVPSSGTVEVQRLHWYDGTYDKGYQGVVDALELVGEGVALISVQRSSQLIVHDLTTGMKQGSIKLADRGGNPKYSGTQFR